MCTRIGSWLTLLAVLHSRVTPVEKLYAAFPMFLYYNATLLKPLLVPLLEQQADVVQFPYASKDLGTTHIYGYCMASLSSRIGTTFPTVLGPSLFAPEAIEREFALSRHVPSGSC